MWTRCTELFSCEVYVLGDERGQVNRLTCLLCDRVVWEHLSEEVTFELKNYKNQPCKDLGGEYCRQREEYLQRFCSSEVH